VFCLFFSLSRSVCKDDAFYGRVGAIDSSFRSLAKRMKIDYSIKYAQFEKFKLYELYFSILKIRAHF
jgi:hypothetical protein